MSSLRFIPGLRSLRSFEAAARRLSFTKAAGELGVTPAAISHQIRELEDQLQVALFSRTSRSMRLTREGEILQSAVGECLNGLSQAVARIKKARSERQLRVTASPSIAAKWLVPRMDHFLALHPDANVRIDISQAVPDVARDDVHVAIRGGTGNFPGLNARRLFQETLFPVCSPSLLEGSRQLRTPSDLLHHNLIHIEWGATWPDWRMWMMAAGIREFDDSRGLHFSQTSLALQAALDGQGVALGESTLVADDLAAGRLVRPFDLALKAPPQFAYYVITSPDSTTMPMIRAFEQWVLDEAAATSPN